MIKTGFKFDCFFFKKVFESPRCQKKEKFVHTVARGIDIYPAGYCRVIKKGHLEPPIAASKKGWYNSGDCGNICTCSQKWYAEVSIPSLGTFN